MTDSTSREVAGRRPSSRRWAILLLASAVFTTGGLALAVYREPVLVGIGSLLVVEDELIRGDVVLPLAGGQWDREIEAADLLRAGYASSLLLTREPRLGTVAYLTARGIHLPTADETRVKVLVALGVPRERITFIEDPVTSTYDEARFVGAWAVQAGVRVVLVVTSPQHTARAKYIFERSTGAGEVRFVVRPTALGEFRPETWWRHRPTLREGIIELQKLVAYRLWY